MGTNSDRTARRLGAQIRLARKTLGLNQSELGELLGITGDYVYLTETGRHPKYFERLVDMLDAVGLSLIAVPKTQLDQGPLRWIDLDSDDGKSDA